MLYNINIKIIGDTWENQDAHDMIVSGFENTIERMLSANQVGLFFRGDINFEYYVDQMKFSFISIKGNKLSSNVNHIFETDREFQKKYYKK